MCSTFDSLVWCETEPALGEFVSENGSVKNLWGGGFLGVMKISQPEYLIQTLWPVNIKLLELLDCIHFRRVASLLHPPSHCTHLRVWRWHLWKWYEWKANELRIILGTKEKESQLLIVFHSKVGVNGSFCINISLNLVHNFGHIFWKEKTWIVVLYVVKNNFMIRSRVSRDGGQNSPLTPNR